MLHFVYPSIPPRWVLVAECAYSMASGLFLATLLLGEGVVNELLRSRVLVLIGKLSYGMYLIHLLVLNVADRVVRPGSGGFSQSFASYLLTCVLSVAGAYVLSVAIERPCISIGKRISASIQRRRLRVG